MKKPTPEELAALQAQDDLAHMQAAIELARGAALAGEVPVGALVVGPQGDVLGRGYNRTRLDVDPSAHAEIVALREAAWRVGNHRLGGCVLYVTLEPCAMCAGAIIQARLAAVVYGADDPKAGALRSVLQLAAHPQLNHRFAVRAGVAGAACATLLREFFQQRRSPDRAAPLADLESPEAGE